jgi:hypothetical protein
MILARHFIIIHYYKTSGTIGASSACTLLRRSFTPAYLRSFRPESTYHCDVNYDPFTFLRENKKTYGLFIFSYLASRTNQIKITPQLRVHHVHARRPEDHPVAVAHCERCILPPSPQHVDPRAHATLTEQNS